MWIVEKKGLVSYGHQEAGKFRQLKPKMLDLGYTYHSKHHNPISWKYNAIGHPLLITLGLIMIDAPHEDKKTKKEDQLGKDVTVNIRGQWPEFHG